MWLGTIGLQSIPWNLPDKDSAAMLEENKLHIQQLLMRFFCLSSSNMAATTLSVNEEYEKSSREV